MPQNNIKDIKKYKLKRVARFFMDKNKFKIEIKDEKIAALEKTIYAFVINGKFVRIGSSKGVLRRRFRVWERDVTNRLKGKKSPTPEREARGWENLLRKYGEGYVFARQGTIVKTPVGNFPAYLDEESVLIGRHSPPLNRSKHR